MESKETARAFPMRTNYKTGLNLMACSVRDRRISWHLVELNNIASSIFITLLEMRADIAAQQRTSLGCYSSTNRAEAKIPRGCPWVVSLCNIAANFWTQYIRGCRATLGNTRCFPTKLKTASSHRSAIALLSEISRRPSGAEVYTNSIILQYMV